MDILRPSMVTACLMALTCCLYGQTAVIHSFAPNGVLVCTNLTADSVANVERADTMTGTWTTNWAGFNSVTADANSTIQFTASLTNGSGFFRVQWTPAPFVLPIIQPSVSSIVMDEGDTIDFTVVLTARPLPNTTVTVTNSKPSKATTTPSSLVFTPANFVTSQTVSVFAKPDADFINEILTVNLSSPGLSNRTVNVTIIDTNL